MGVIESLSAGYRFLGRRLELLLVPILLDLLLWLGPRLSVAPLFKQLSAFYLQAADVEGMPAEMADMSQQMATLLQQTGESSNLLSALANSSLLHVPSLLATGISIGTNTAIEVQSPLTAGLLLLGFSLIGVLFGVIYMDMLARILPLGDGPKPIRFEEFVATVLRHWVMVLLYALLLVVALVIGSIPIALLVTLLSLISPVISSLLVMLLSGMMLVLFFYLYFVSAALIMDNLPVHRAIMQSFVMVRSNFWATFGFVLLYNVIMLGFAYLMTSVATMTPIGTIAAILIYAYIGSGLAMALLVFYRTRILKLEEATVTAA